MPHSPDGVPAPGRSASCQLPPGSGHTVACRDGVSECRLHLSSPYHPMIPHSSCCTLARASWTTRWIHEYSHRHVEHLHIHNTDSIATSPRGQSQGPSSPPWHSRSRTATCGHESSGAHRSWPSNWWCRHPRSMSPCHCPHDGQCWQLCRTSEWRQPCSHNI